MERREEEKSEERREKRQTTDERVAALLLPLLFISVARVDREENDAAQSVAIRREKSAEDRAREREGREKQSEPRCCGRRTRLAAQWQDCQDGEGCGGCASFAGERERAVDKVRASSGQTRVRCISGKLNN